jgi:hypothetical protein
MHDAYDAHDAQMLFLQLHCVHDDLLNVGGIVKAIQHTAYNCHEYDKGSQKRHLLSDEVHADTVCVSQCTRLQL